MTTQNKVTNFNEYTISISAEPSYYGTDCTADDAARIVENLGELISSEFPGISIVEHFDGQGSGKTTGPDQSVCDDINQWVSENWTAAL